MDEKLKVFEDKMQKSYNNLLEEYTTIRAGRANPHVLDKVVVDYYGAPTGGKYQCAGSTYDPDPALGVFFVKGY